MGLFIALAAAVVATAAAVGVGVGAAALHSSSAAEAMMEEAAAAARDSNGALATLVDKAAIGLQQWRAEMDSALQQQLAAAGEAERSVDGLRSQMKHDRQRDNDAAVLAAQMQQKALEGLDEEMQREHEAQMQAIAGWGRRSTPTTQPPRRSSAPTTPR